MAKIIRTNEPIISDDNFEEATSAAVNYWGDLSLEKMFPIPFWEVKQKLAASTSNTIALRVTNIQDATWISARWIVFEELLADSLQDPVEQGIYYFILEDKIFNGPLLLNTNPISNVEGLANSTNSPENSIIRGRIGKNGEGEYFAFFQIAECILIEQGGGGGGALTGAKISKKKK